MSRLMFAMPGPSVSSMVGLIRVPSKLTASCLLASIAMSAPSRSNIKSFLPTSIALNCSSPSAIDLLTVLDMPSISIAKLFAAAPMLSKIALAPLAAFHAVAKSPPASAMLSSVFSFKYTFCVSKGPSLLPKSLASSVLMVSGFQSPTGFLAASCAL